MWYKNYSSEIARKKYWANKKYWGEVWRKRKQREALQRGRYDPSCSIPDVSSRFYNIKPQPIPKYIKAYTDEEIELILNFLNKARERAREYSYNAFTREVERTEHYYNLLIDEHNLRREPKLRFMDDRDKECRMEISKFKSSCIYGAISAYDGSGFYATADMISNIPAYPAAVCAGHIRKDFKYICWYNK